MRGLSPMASAWQAGPAQSGPMALEIRPEVIKAGKSLCFATALVLADDSICAQASGVFKVVSA